MDIRIMLLVGSNGKASVAVEGDLGWGDLADNIMDWDPIKRESTDPEASARYIVNVWVEMPCITEKVAFANPVAEGEKPEEEAKP